jgi:hypothetical protein
MRTLMLVIPVILVAACSKTPPLPATLDAAEPEVLFDTVAGPPAHHTFYFANDGGEPTHPLTVELRGDVAQFALADDTCSGIEIGPKGACTVDISFSADDAGVYQGQLHVTDGVSLYADVSMSGRVGDASLAIAGSVATVFEGATKSATVTVTNEGGARSGALAVTVPGATLVDDGCTGATIAGGDSCTVGVRYAAPFGTTGATSLTATVVGDPGGTAAGPVGFTVESGAPLTVTDVSFGSWDPAHIGARQLIVTNPSTIPVGPLTLTVVTTTEMPQMMIEAFLISTTDTCTGATLAPQGACIVDVMTGVGLPVPGTFIGALTATAPNAHAGSGLISLNTVNAHGTLQLSKGGTGDGSILVGSPAVPLCGTGPTSCGAVDLFDGQSFTFTATPASGSVFAGWMQGPCGGSTSATCTIVGADQATSLEAVFNLQ